MTDSVATSSWCKPILARLNNSLQMLAIGTWFGALVMLAISAAMTFQTVREYQPTLQQQPFDQPELASRTDAILAGAIVGRSLQGLKWVQIICAVIIVTTLALQLTAFKTYLLKSRSSLFNLVRLILLAIPIVVLMVDILWITPAIWEYRDAMYAAPASAEVRMEAREHFDRYHKLSERTVSLAAFSLLGAAVVSSMVLGSSARLPRPQRIITEQAD